VTGGPPARRCRPLTDDRDALLAMAMNGQPLPFEHGFPVRLVVPGLYGFVSATKWVTSLKVTTFADDQAYWTPRGWSERGPVKTESRIDVPRAGDRVSAGKVAVAGIAWAQHRGIVAVQVRVDNGEWQPARLADEPSIDSWRQWVLEWQAVKGNHTITVRASRCQGCGADPDGGTTGAGWRHRLAHDHGQRGMTRPRPDWTGPDRTEPVPTPGRRGPGLGRTWLSRAASWLPVGAVASL